MGFRVTDTSSRETLPGIPTPFLIERGGGVAYGVRVGQLDDTVWYSADYPGYVPPVGAEKRSVRVLHTDDHRVDVHIRVLDASVDENDKEAVDALEWDDYFIVEAVDRQDAESQAYVKAAAEVERQFGVEGEPGYEGSVVDIIRVQKGVSI